MSRTPWMKWFPSDWRADAKLGACDPMTRYVWMEMLGLMHEGEPYGHLTIAGRKITPDTLSRLIRVPLKAVKSALRELDLNAVFSVTDDGVIYSRRMVREDFRATSSRVNGAKGGNPALRNQWVADGRDKGRHKVEDNTQKPDARYQSPESPIQLQQQQSVTAPERAAPPAAAAVPPGEIPDSKTLERMCREAAGLENDPAPGWFNVSQIIDLMVDGFDLSTDILPVIRTKAAECRVKGSHPRTWGFFVPVIREAKVRRLAAANASTPQARSPFASPAMKQAEVLRAELQRMRAGNDDRMPQ